MKFKECWHLSKIIIKQNKKSIKSTTMALSAGFIILLPLLVCLFGINVSISKQYNQCSYAFSFQMTDVYSDEVVKSYINNKDTKDVILYEKYYFPSSLCFKVGQMDDFIEMDSGDFEKMDTSNFFSIVDTSYSTAYFPENLISKFPNGIFLEGCDSGFDNNGKRQVIVSEHWANTQGLTADNLYMHDITFKGSVQLSSKTLVDGFLCKDYKVVGIVKQEVYEFFKKNDYSSYLLSDLIFTDVNAYKDGKGVLVPQLELNSSGDKKTYVYPNIAEKDILNDEYMMLGFGHDLEGTYDLDSTGGISKKSLYIDSNKFQDLYNVYSESQAKYDQDEIYLITSNYFSRLSMVYEFVVAISYLLIFVGVVLVSSAIINLFASLKHDIKERKSFLIMLRAIGAKDNAIPKLYFAELSVIISKANLFIISIGTIISIAIKLIIDNALDLSWLDISLSIPWSVVFICVAAVVIFLYLISFVFAYISTKKLSKSNIMSVINQGE